MAPHVASSRQESPRQVPVRDPSFIRRLAFAGIIGPPLFILLTIVEDVLQYRFLVTTGNDPLVVSPFSVNALGPTGWLQVLSFILFGLSIIALALGLHRGVQAGKWSKIAIGLLIVVGVTMILSGIFTEDSVKPGNPMTFHGLVHDLSFFAFLLVQMAMYFFLWWRFRQDERWRGYDWYSLVVGILVLPLFVGFNGFLDSHDGFYLWFLLVPLAWLEVVAIRLWMISRRNVPIREGKVDIGDGHRPYPLSPGEHAM
jgi:hypothetical membrane protein